MEAVGVVVAVGDAFEDAVFLAVDFSEAASETFGGGGEEGVVEVVFFGVFVTFFAHVGNDVEAKFASVGVFAVVLASHGDEGFGEADEADA